MDQHDPLLSIIMATYNRAHLIEETLLSIQQQTYRKWECLIIDDGCTDRTMKVLKPFLQADIRFKYYLRTKEYKKGLPGSRNMGLKLAKGEYIIFFDDDDIVHPENLKTCFDLFQKYSVDFCNYQKKPFVGDWNENLLKNQTFFNVKNIGLEDIEQVITGEIGLSSCTVMWKKKCFDIIRFNEDLMYAEEWECYSRIVISGCSGISINKILYYNRKHKNSNTGEFKLNDPIRRSSKAEAIKLVINNLKKERLLTNKLIKFFIQTAFSLKDFILLSFILEKSGFNKIKVLTYKFIYQYYPWFKPFFKLKAKL